MKNLRVGTAVLNQTPLDWAGNQKRILEVIEAAKAQEVKALCLPELCISGYGCEDAFFSPSTQARSLKSLTEILPHTRGILVCMGLPLHYQDWILNTAAVIWDGQVLGFSAKQFLASDGVFYEPRWFRPWPKKAKGEVSYFGSRIPVGDLSYQVGDLSFGCEICEDGWSLNRPGREFYEKGVELIFSLNASPFSLLKHQTRTRYVLESSRSLSVVYLYSNLLGCEAGRLLFDGGSLIANCGELVGASARMGLKETGLLVADVNLDQCRRSRGHSQGFEAQMEPLGTIDISIKSDSICVDRTEPRLPDPLPDWENSNQLKEEEFTRAVTMGLFDYLRKTHSGGFVVSLSGGADSTAVTCLVSLCIMRAIQELGQDGTAEILSHIPDIKTAGGYTGLVRKLLICAYQGTENSSEQTLKAAKIICRDLKIPFLVLDVDHFYKAYVGVISNALDQEIGWERHDLALQNIQARVRAPGIWLLANLRNSLLLCTSNRSEAAVGYATMDGDSCGGLAPIVGVDKEFIRNWLLWLESNGPLGLGRFPILRIVNEQKPSAELRPLEDSQLDEDDLMPYEILDYVERAFLIDRLSPSDIFSNLKSQYLHRYEEVHLKEWVQRFFRLWSRNQWKRERFAPGFFLDQHSLDPKTWCRFPILSGGYELELEELEEQRT